MNLRIIFLLAGVFAFQITFGQNIIDSVKIYNFPLKEGIIYMHQNFFSCEPVGISICSPLDSVFHFENGIVVAVFDMGDSKAAVVKNGKNEYFTYGNLKTVLVKKGNFIKRGDCIGIILKDDFGIMNNLDFIIMHGIKNLSTEKMLDYIEC